MDNKDIPDELAPDSGWSAYRDITKAAGLGATAFVLAQLSIHLVDGVVAWSLIGIASVMAVLYWYYIYQCIQTVK